MCLSEMSSLPPLFRRRRFYSYVENFFNDPSCSGMQRQDSSMSQGASVQPDTGPLKAMGKSFMAVDKSESSLYGGATNLPSPDGGPSGSVQPNNSEFQPTMTALKHAFEIATNHIQVELPVCLDCMRILYCDLDETFKEVNIETYETYGACLKRLEGKTWHFLSEADFLNEKLKTEEEEQKLEAEIGEMEKLLGKKNRYWHEFNNCHFQLIFQQEKRDAFLAKIEVSPAHLELLKGNNVFNDAFSIWHDGEFGTINNSRLGRLPKNPVGWDETNAAWGQACLLQHTMCEYFWPEFLPRIKILPMGSYPQIMDDNNDTYELFGPVNTSWSNRYDKAMTLFLTCHKDFAEFANSKDQENNIPLEKCFKLPYKIENDKVKNYSIKQNFNNQENYTKALKYTLCNLKWALYWFVGNTNFQSLLAMDLQMPRFLLLDLCTESC